jgi:hypothetical protein
VDYGYLSGASSRREGRVAWYFLILIKLSVKAVVGSPSGWLRVQLSATRAVVLIPIRLGAKATPGALWGRLAIARGPLYHTCVLTNLILLPGPGPRGPDHQWLGRWRVYAIVGGRSRSPACEGT